MSIRVFQVGHFGLLKPGNWYPSICRKLLHGLIRGGYDVQPFSDRDWARALSVLGLRAIGWERAGRMMIEKCEELDPDLVIVGHADHIPSRAFLALKRALPRVRIAKWQADALFVPESARRLERAATYADVLFVTTAGEHLAALRYLPVPIAFMPNPVDPAIESHRNFEKDAAAFARDLVFCGSVKPGNPRRETLLRLKEDLSDLRFTAFGVAPDPPIYGPPYKAALGESKMGLNRNQEEVGHLYSSDRISQLVGNGLLTFISAKSGYQEFLGADGAAWFDDYESLVRQIRAFHADDARRKAVARVGCNAYHRLFDAALVARYIVETALELRYTRDYAWRRYGVGSR